MNQADSMDALAFDRAHVWHPYSSAVDPAPTFLAESAEGVRITLADGRSLIDGMASWWSVIHGYRHPTLDRALHEQVDRMAHVMFGGLTHAPAIDLARRLVEITPARLSRVFFADSGSVAVEVAIKMVLQYWASRGQPRRHRLLALRGGYHGDTFGAMSVCDPVTGMHGMFAGVLPQQVFAPRPALRFDATWDPAATAELEAMFARHCHELAAVIVEPVVQGAGGMWFYHPGYLRRLRELCDDAGVLLIADEIATGFGRSGRLFACEHAGIEPDVMCLGKGLTGGYMTLAATLTSDAVAQTVCAGTPGVLMHGPTFMANPLACAVAGASVDLLLSGPWIERIAAIERGLRRGLEPARVLPGVADVRVLGAIGVIELKAPIDMRRAPDAFVARGVWVRPFGRLVYTMPPYIIADDDIATLCAAMVEVVAELAAV